MASLPVVEMPAPVPALPKLLYDRKSAAYVLSMSVRAVDYLIANKIIKARHIGGKILIPTGELKRFASADHPDLIVRKKAA